MLKRCARIGTRKSFAVATLLVWAAVLGWAGGAGEAAPVVSVYSHRHYEVDRRLYKRFTEETGIRVNVVNAGAD